MKYFRFFNLLFLVLLTACVSAVNTTELQTTSIPPTETLLPTLTLKRIPTLTPTPILTPTLTPTRDPHIPLITPLSNQHYSNWNWDGDTVQLWGSNLDLCLWKQNCTVGPLVNNWEGEDRPIYHFYSLRPDIKWDYLGETIGDGTIIMFDKPYRDIVISTKKPFMIDYLGTIVLIKGKQEEIPYGYILNSNGKLIQSNIFQDDYMVEFPYQIAERDVTRIPKCGIIGVEQDKSYTRLGFNGSASIMFRVSNIPVTFNGGFTPAQFSFDVLGIKIVGELLNKGKNYDVCNPK